jgi:ABC-type Fe3+-hydroxamate transport system substrate-binding protein
MRREPIVAGLKLRLLLAFVALCASASTPASPADVKQIAIVGVTVVNPEREAKDAAVSDATVVISGDRIVAVGSRASTPVPAGAMQIGSGASADHNLRSVAEALKGTLISGGKRLKIRY